MNIRLTTAIFAALILPPAASAQDAGAAPTFGEVSLSSGFTPDPYMVELRSGGSIDAARTLGGNCVGFVASAPDFDLYFNAGSLPLIISVAAAADTTLVINGPDGEWYCDDDSGDGLNPSIRFAAPQTGLYDIWVGTYADNSLQEATLSISELVSQ